MDDGLSEFISPFLKSDKADEVITVTPQDPGRNNKVYVIKKEAGLTGRNYVHCSSCQHRSFKLFCNVTRPFAPDHLKQYGNSDNEVLKFCRACWYGVNTRRHKRGTSVSRPHFERGPLGVTGQRACFSWHFIQRDFVRKKHRNEGESKHENDDLKRPEGSSNYDLMFPLVSVFGQDGSEFVKKDCNANLFNLDGKEICIRKNESACLPNDSSPTSEKQDLVSNILMNIHKDHDYAPAMQREIEITTSAKSPVKNYSLGNNLQKPSAEMKAEMKSNRRAYKIKYNQLQVKQAANKLLKKAVLFEGAQRQPHNFVTVNLPVSKVEEELRSKREKGEDPDPTHLIGLKARAEDGQTLPGLICPLCGKYTVKSYSVWKKSNAPAKIMHLFKDGVTVIRACRKCVPYPINRERDKKKSDNNENFRHSSVAAQISAKISKTHSQGMVKGGKVIVNGYGRKGSHDKHIRDATKVRGHEPTVKGEESKYYNLPVKNNGKFGGQVDRGTEASQLSKKTNEENVDRLRQKRNGIDSEEDRLRKKARIEEKKRTIEEASGHELTGLECFESLQSEDKIDTAEEDSLLCTETQKDCDVKENKEQGNVRRPRGRPSKPSVACDKCNSPLGKTYRTVKFSNCPKKLIYFFKENRNRRSMKICKNCIK